MRAAISSDSILVALLDSPYTDLAEMADEASLLPTLEQTVSSFNITILAPRNSFLSEASGNHGLDPDFRQFLLEPGNLRSLRELLLFHIIPRRISSSQWKNQTVSTLAGQPLEFSVSGSRDGLGRRKLRADLSSVVVPGAIKRRDGVVHGIDRLLIPRSVQSAYNAWKERQVRDRMLAVLPEQSPTPDSYRVQKAKAAAAAAAAAALKARAYAPPSDTIYDALAPSPSFAPAPAPGPSSRHNVFDGESVVADFISTLVGYGGYNEMADLLVNLTSLAPVLAKLVTEGYRMTILAPNDEAMKELPIEQLAAPGAPELIIYYHIIPEYQTEESFYNAVRRFGQVSYQTLRESHKLVAEEEDGTVVFGEGKDKAHLVDIDIFKDGRISVQGIDKVLSPPQTSNTTTSRRKLGEVQEDLGQEDQDQKTKDSEELYKKLFSFFFV